MLLALIALAGCGDGDGATTPSPSPATPVQLTPRPFHFLTPAPATPRPIPTGLHSFDGTTPLPDLSPDAAVYLSLGDSLQYGCCDDPQLSSHPLFAHYLSQRLNRPVVWVSLAGNDTAVEFIEGIDGQPPQLDRAVALLERFRSEGRAVVAITLSIGGNDLLLIRDVCGGAGGSSEGCVQAFTDFLNAYDHQLDLIYGRLEAAKDPNTPILQNNLYNAMDCGDPAEDISVSEIGVRIFNNRVQTAAHRNGAFLRDFYPAFKDKACEYISGVDPTYAGYDAIFEVDRALYESLPPEYVEPFAR